MSKIVYEVTVENGDTWWRLKGELHREDGPAVEWKDGTKKWFINSLYHREDGPAIERTDGTYEWYLDGKHYTEEEFDKEIAKRKDSCDGKVIEIDGKKYKLSEYNE